MPCEYLVEKCGIEDTDVKFFTGVADDGVQMAFDCHLRMELVTVGCDRLSIVDGCYLLFLQTFFGSVQLKIDLSSRKIGLNMTLLSSTCSDQEIFQWRYSDTPTTKKVTQKSDIEKMIEGAPEPAPLES